MPFKEAVDFLNKLNPLLGDFLTFRTNITLTGMLLEEAAKKSVMTSEYDDSELSYWHFYLAAKYRKDLSYSLISFQPCAFIFVFSPEFNTKIFCSVSVTNPIGVISGIPFTFSKSA